MTMLAIVAVAAIITYATIWTKYFAMALITAAMWVFVGYYANANPPWGLVAGDVGMNMLMAIFYGVAVAVPGYIVLTTGREKSEFWDNGGNEQEASRFSIRRFLTNGDIGNRAIPRKRKRTTADYEAQIDGALHPRRRRR